MTIEQLQALLDTVSDTQNQLVSMMTALALAIELFDELASEDHAHLQAAWQQQLCALRTLPTCLSALADPVPEIGKEHRGKVKCLVGR